MLPHLADTGNDKYTFAIQNFFKVLRICVLTLKCFIKEVFSADAEMIKFY